MSSVGNGETGLSSASSYVETYMDYVEALPDDMQRHISQMRELDMLYQEKLREIGRLIDTYHRCKESSVRSRCLIQIQRCLVKSQEYGDKKLHHVSYMMDMVDTKSRQVEIEMESAELGNDQMHAPMGKQDMHDDEIINQRAPEKVKRNRRHRLQEKGSKDREVETSMSMSNFSDNPKPTKKKKVNRKKRTKENNSPTPDVPIDPNEPTYCLCNQVSYGEMIGCDNDDCEIEWFHFQCVNLTQKPKGRWYCPKCSQERKQKKTEKSDKNEKSEK